MIKFLARYGEPTSPKHLAESLNLSSARIAVVLGSLEKKGKSNVRWIRMIAAVSMLP